MKVTISAILSVILLVGTVWAETTTRYLRTDGRSGNAPFTSDVENADPTRMMVPSNGFLTGMYCKFENTRPDIATFTARKNRTDTALTCATTATEAECRVISRIVVAAGDAISVKIVDTNPEEAPIVYCSVYYDLQ